jgi:DNA-3-methyladenine glycosylase II
MFTLFYLKVLYLNSYLPKRQIPSTSRFEALFKNEYPKPKEILKLDNETLRSVGLSGQKSGYIKALAEYAIVYDMSYEHISSLSNEELIEQLTSIKGWDNGL